MRVLVLTVALVVAMSAASFAEIASYDIYEGWQMISCPLVPLNSDPYAVFAGAPGGIDFLLSGWDPSTGGKPFEGDPVAFGGILLGDGFWLYVDTGMGGTISYDGVANGVSDLAGTKTDMWISLPGNQNDAFTEPSPVGDPNAQGGGWHMIGLPYNNTVCVNKVTGGAESYVGDRILFTDGTTSKTWDEAVQASWVDYKMSGFDTANSAFDIQYDGGGFSTNLDPGKGYWFQTYKDNLAMIILAYN